MVQSNKGKILIVDDEAHIRMLIAQTLEELEDKGIQIINAADGAEAVQLVKKELPNLVFLDVMMPKLNGFDACKQIKQDLGLKSVTVVMLTAKGQEFDRQRGKEVGADLYITKPFDPDEILSIANKIFT